MLAYQISQNNSSFSSTNSYPSDTNNDSTDYDDNITSPRTAQQASQQQTSYHIQYLSHWDVFQGFFECIQKDLSSSLLLQLVYMHESNPPYPSYAPGFDELLPYYIELLQHHDFNIVGYGLKLVNQYLFSSPHKSNNLNYKALSRFYKANGVHYIIKIITRIFPIIYHIDQEEDVVNCNSNDDIFDIDQNEQNGYKYDKIKQNEQNMAVIFNIKSPRKLYSSTHIFFTALTLLTDTLLCVDHFNGDNEDSCVDIKNKTKVENKKIKTTRNNKNNKKQQACKVIFHNDDLIDLISSLCIAMRVFSFITPNNTSSLPSRTNQYQQQQQQISPSQQLTAYIIFIGITSMLSFYYQQPSYYTLYGDLNSRLEVVSTIIPTLFHHLQYFMLTWDTSPFRSELYQALTTLYTTTLQYVTQKLTFYIKKQDFLVKYDENTQGLLEPWDEYFDVMYYMGSFINTVNNNKKPENIEDLTAITATNMKDTNYLLKSTKHTTESISVKDNIWIGGTGDYGYGYDDEKEEYKEESKEQGNYSCFDLYLQKEQQQHNIDDILGHDNYNNKYKDGSDGDSGFSDNNTDYLQQREDLQNFVYFNVLKQCDDIFNALGNIKILTLLTQSGPVDGGDMNKAGNDNGHVLRGSHNNTNNIKTTQKNDMQQKSISSSLYHNHNSTQYQQTTIKQQKQQQQMRNNQFSHLFSCIQIVSMLLQGYVYIRAQQEQVIQYSSYSMINDNCDSDKDNNFSNKNNHISSLSLFRCCNNIHLSNIMHVIDIMFKSYDDIDDNNNNNCNHKNSKYLFVDNNSNNNSSNNNNGNDCKSVDENNNRKDKNNNGNNNNNNNNQTSSSLLSQQQQQQLSTLLLDMGINDNSDIISINCKDDCNNGDNPNNQNSLNIIKGLLQPLLSLLLPQHQLQHDNNNRNMNNNNNNNNIINVEKSSFLLLQISILNILTTCYKLPWIFQEGDVKEEENNDDEQQQQQQQQEKKYQKNLILMDNIIHQLGDVIFDRILNNNNDCCLLLQYIDDYDDDNDDDGSSNNNNKKDNNNNNTKATFIDYAKQLVFEQVKGLYTGDI